MTDYTEQELRQMQEEALQRLRQMQEQAQRTALQNGWESSSPQPPQPPPPPPQPDAYDPFRGQISSPLSGLMQWAGGERGILLALLAVLMGEGADPALLLALFYLAMFDDPAETK